MGDWEKTRYRNVKRNYNALITIGNRKFWEQTSLGDIKQVFGPYIILVLRWRHLPTIPFSM